jgi:2-hydroxychromene-2-carboxylate isomerase
VTAPVFHFDVGSPYAHLAAERVERLPMKRALREATERAAELGVRGVPSVIVAGTVFFGDDRLEAAARAA